MRPLAILAIAVAAALSPVAFAEQPMVTGAIGTAPGKGAAMQVVQVSATVESVDAATRTVTLKLPNGEMRSFVAGDEVRNFDQIKAGDKLSVKYLEAFTIELKKNGKDIVGRTESASLERAAPGEKPGGVAKREVRAVADVVDVDEQKMIVSVRNDKGEITDLHLQDPEQVKLVKKGDQVEAIYTEALAISLEPEAMAKK
ncbi:MAG TPA: hypothetical protein VLY46_00555 [Usitatibacter sp.]|nr:hypothetical protein [Usitatibacter sp.]